MRSSHSARSKLLRRRFRGAAVVLATALAGAAAPASAAGTFQGLGSP